MLINQDDDKGKSWLPYVIGMTATAILSTLGSKLVEWGVDEIRAKYGSKKKEDQDDQEGLPKGG